MTKKHVLAAFKRAGFPLRSHSARWVDCRYDSSLIKIRLRDHEPGDMGLWVCFGNGKLTEFKSVASALRCIRGRLAMGVVAGNEWALNTPARGQLRLVAA